MASDYEAIPFAAAPATRTIRWGSLAPSPVILPLPLSSSKQSTVLSLISAVKFSKPQKLDTNAH